MKNLADKKKQNNIAEYVLYMYQMEDLIRSYEFNIPDIEQYVVSHYPISDEEKIEIKGWFAELGEKMKVESIQKNGHLSDVQKIVDDLAKLHWTLLKEDKDYYLIYNLAKPYIIDFIASSEGKSPGHEIQICFNGLYGLLLCRLTGKTVSEELESAATSFGQVLGYLNGAYLEKNKS